MKKFYTIIILILSTCVCAHDKTHWVEIGDGTYDYGFDFPYKIKLYVPFGVRDIPDIKEGLFPMKFELSWLLFDSSQKGVQDLFANQIKDNYLDKESHKLSEIVIGYFLKKLPTVKKHDSWTFTYYPDEGTKLYIDEKMIHHLVGAELNRALVQSWLNKNPALTANLFNRLIKLQR